MTRGTKGEEGDDESESVKERLGQRIRFRVFVKGLLTGSWDSLSSMLDDSCNDVSRMMLLGEGRESQKVEKEG